MLIEHLTNEQLGKIVRENLYDTFGNFEITNETGIGTACAMFLVETFLIKGLKDGSIDIRDAYDFSGKPLGHWKVTVEKVNE